MIHKKVFMREDFKEFDKKEFHFADTVFVRDIDTRVFQSIVIKSLATIEDVAPLGGSLFDHLLGREGEDRIKGIHVEQDHKNHSVSIKIELNISHGISIPQKAEEVQTKVADDICTLTGLHVACVHVIFKALISDTPLDVNSEIKNEPVPAEDFTPDAFE